MKLNVTRLIHFSYTKILYSADGKIEYVVQSNTYSKMYDVLLETIVWQNSMLYIIFEYSLEQNIFKIHADRVEPLKKWLYSGKGGYQEKNATCSVAYVSEMWRALKSPFTKWQRKQ